MGEVARSMRARIADPAEDSPDLPLSYSFVDR